MKRSDFSPDQLEAIPRQTSLLALGQPDVPTTMDGVGRTDLGSGAWIDHCENWLPGADAWFDILTSTLKWSQASRPMYDRVVDVPRLIVSYKRNSKVVPHKLNRLARVFDQHYERYFTSIGCNWYRDGSDSVAMHRDRIKNPNDSIIAIVSVGQKRTLILKPDNGGASLKFQLGDGDLFVMGGTTQLGWQHAVPKVKNAGSRVCMMFRG